LCKGLRFLKKMLRKKKLISHKLDIKEGDTVSWILLEVNYMGREESDFEVRTGNPIVGNLVYSSQKSRKVLPFSRLRGS